MSAHVPFDIQTLILKNLPVKSLIRFCCVSKQWKTLINSSEFIKNYQTVNDRHLLVRNNVERYIADTDVYLSTIDEYFSIIDNDAFPQHMSPITVPLSVKTRERVRTLYSRVSIQPVRILGSSCGLICFHGYNKDCSEMVVFWNPSIRKSVSVLLEPTVRLGTAGRVGFGVCPETCDPKLLKIDNIRGTQEPEVQVYTLSTRAWKKVSLKPPYIPCGLRYDEGVCVEGFIYYLARDDMGNGLYYIVSFDLSNDEFGKVKLPYNLPRTECLELSKCNECLAVFDYFDFENHSFNYMDLWVMKEDGVRKYFTMMFRIETIYDVLELRKNGEAIRIKTRDANDDDVVNPILQVYDPCSGRVNDIRIPRSGHADIGNTTSTFSISSYMETLVLLDQ